MFLSIPLSKFVNKNASKQIINLLWLVDLKILFLFCVAVTRLFDELSVQLSMFLN